MEGGAIRSVEESRPKPGLSVPVLTVLDEDGRLIEEDQRALVRHVVQDGAGADIVFSAGTTGEWDKIDNPTRQAVIRVCAEEVAKLNPGLVATTGVRVESWAGVTAPTALKMCLQAPRRSSRRPPRAVAESRRRRSLRSSVSKRNPVTAPA